MNCKKTTELQGNEYLTKQVISSSGELLMSEGTVLKPEYIKKLIQHGIEYVIVEENYEKKRKAKEMRIHFEKDIKANVQDILEQHVYGNAKELSQLCNVAQELMDDVIQDDNLAAEIAEIKEHSADIYSHSLNVSFLATLLASKAGYDKQTVKEVATGALLHDVGLRYVTADYTSVELTDEKSKDAAEIRQHVIFGYDVLEKEKWLSDLAKEIVLCHHERLDGKGFPFKYEGAQVRKTTQIVVVCDLFDRMICGMGCKKRSKGQAAKEIEEGIGTICEEDIINLFFNFIAIYPVGCEVKLSSGERAVVQRQNPGEAKYPVLMVRTDNKGKAVKPYSMDLRDNKNIKIEELIG